MARFLLFIKTGTALLDQGSRPCSRLYDSKSSRLPSTKNPDLSGPVLDGTVQLVLRNQR